MSTADSNASDLSGYFTITNTKGDKGTITVTWPNGGEEWLYDDNKYITWTSTNVGEEVKIEVYKAGSKISCRGPCPSARNGGKTDNAGQAGRFRFDGAEESASYGGTPVPAGDDYKIRITDVSNSEVYDESDGFFSIKEQSGPWGIAKWVSPSHGDSWVVGQTYSLLFSATRLSNQSDIDNFSCRVTLTCTWPQNGSRSVILGNVFSANESFQYTVPSGIDDVEFPALRCHFGADSCTYHYDGVDWKYQPKRRGVCLLGIANDIGC